MLLVKQKWQSCRQSGLHVASAAQGGFTLIELLVVFAIAALLAAVSPMAFDKLRESAQYRDTVRGILTDLRQAREQAILGKNEMRFQIDLEQRSFGVSGGRKSYIPSTLRVRAIVAGEELSLEENAHIVFMPDGGSSGGSVDILRPQGGGIRVRVDWLTGRLEQESLTR